MSKANIRNIVGKVIVSEETGRRFGVVGDVAFVTESGELMNLIVTEPTKTAIEMGLQEDSNGKVSIPFSAVKSVGDFIIISEKDII